MSITSHGYHTVRSRLLPRQVALIDTSSQRCRPCLARYFSDHVEVASNAAEKEAEPHIGVSSSSSSGSKTSQSMSESGSMRKFHQEVVSLSQPDLAALDELDPSNQRRRRSRQHNFQQTAKAEDWRKTLEKVMHSFTVTQMQRLCTEAGVTAEVFAQYGAGARGKPKKEVCAKALLIHRFRLKDPELQVKAEEQRAKRFRQVKQAEVPVSQIALLMVVLRGQAEVQRLLQVHQVKMKPKRLGSEEDLALVLQGSQDGIDTVKSWIESFVERIQSVSRPLSFFSTSDIPHPPDDHRLRLISQLSRTIVSLDEAAENVTIHSVDEESVASAETMLAQFLFDAQKSHRRQYYTYASPTLMDDLQASVATFAFVPHVGPSPLSWLSDPGTQASLFRLSRQDTLTSQNNVFREHERKRVDKAVLRHFNMPDSYDDSKPTLIGEDPFVQLKQRLDDQNRPSATWTYTAEFGHVLFDNHNHQSVSSRVLSLVKPPVRGSWPLEHGLDWLRKLSRSEVKSSSRPTFCASLPPLAVSLDAGYVPPPPMSSGMSFSNSSGSDRTRQTNDQWSAELMRMGFPLGLSRTKNDLSDLIDLKKFDFVETTVVTYAGRESDLVIELEEYDGEDIWSDSARRIEVYRAEWKKEGASDVMVPESSMDVRLGATRRELISIEDLMQDQGLQRYLKGGEEEGGRDEMQHDDDAVDARPMVLPRRVTVQEQDALFISAKKTSRWEWSMLSPLASEYRGKFILERTAPGEEGGYTSTFKIQFGEKPNDGKQEEGKEGEAAEGQASDEESTSDSSNSTGTQWRHMHLYVDRFLARSYRSIRS